MLEAIKSIINRKMNFMETADIILEDFENNDIMDSLTDDEIAAIRTEIDKHLVEGDLRREVAMNIKNKMEINSYQGSRHKKGLPVRGQRTRTNARTRKGKPKTIANKKK